MTHRVDEFPPCSACGGKLYPLVLCESCGAASILRDAQQLDRAAACAECGTFNSWQLICDQCHSRFPAVAITAKAPPPADAPASKTGVPAAPPGRLKRRVKGELETSALLSMLKTLGLDPSRAQALIDRGYDALWKIARASVDELARIPEVGPVAARKVRASFHLLNYSPPQRTKELIARDEYECPLCGCVTSAFAPACLECGAALDEEEMDESIRRDFADEGDAALLAFYDGRLAEKPDDSGLLYARALLLEALGRIDEAIDALDRAAATARDSRKIKVVQLRIQAKELRKPDVAQKLRSTASSLLDDVAWDQEVSELDHLIAEAGPTCPKCGAVVTKDATRCASCGTRLAGQAAAPTPAAAKPGALPELDTLVDDLLVGELEESLTPEELELTKAAVLDWLIEELEESMGSEAQAAVPREKREGAKAPAEPSLDSDSAGFISEWMRGSRGLVSGLRPKAPPRGVGKVNGIVNGKGRVNGLVNGVGRTNGLVNGVGRVNGLVQPGGRVNGLVMAGGRVNGLTAGHGRVNGFVNETQFVRTGTKGVRLPYPSKRVRYASIASATLVAIIIFGLLFIPIPGVSGPIVIDGFFGDWASVPMFDAATTASDLNVSLERYAALLDSNSLYLFASTRGNMFGDSSGYDGIYFLIDADGDASTGYQFNGIGADSVLEIFGGNYTAEGTRLYTFPPNSEVNWSQRQSLGSAQAAASAFGIEAKVSTYDIVGFDPGRYQISVYADNFRGDSSRAEAALSARGGAVLLEMLPLTLVVGSGPTPLFNFNVRAMGLPPASEWAISGISRTATPGVTVSLSAESVTLTQGQPESTITASVWAPGFFPGDVVEVNITGAVAPVPVFVVGGPVRAYYLSPPSTVRIDGLFSDWVGRDGVDSDPAPVTNPGVDIVRYGGVVNTSTAFFHVAVAGDLLAGRVPERVARPPGAGGNGSGGPPIPLPRQTGEDILRVYIDLNASILQGAPIAGIYADYLFEVRGYDGRIISRALYAWTGTWTSVPLPAVALEKEATDIEGSLVLGPLTNNTRMVFASTDWSGIGDSSPDFASPSFIRSPASLDRPSAGGGPGLIIFSGQNSVTVYAPPLTNLPSVDGNCNSTTGEYQGGDVGSNSALRFLVGTRSEISYVFLCLEVTADTTNNGTADWGELLFDQNHTASTNPESTDRRYRVTSGTSVLVSERGDGSGWVTCGSACDGGEIATGAFNNSKQTYEFKIRFLDVWGTDNPSASAVAGFAIVAHDPNHSPDYIWGSDNVVDTSPATSGHIAVPEFHEIAVPVVGTLLIALALSRRVRRSW